MHCGSLCLGHGFRLAVKWFPRDALFALERERLVGLGEAVRVAERRVVGGGMSQQQSQLGQTVFLNLVTVGVGAESTALEPHRSRVTLLPVDTAGFGGRGCDGRGGRFLGRCSHVILVRGVVLEHFLSVLLPSASAGTLLGFHLTSTSIGWR